MKNLLLAACIAAGVGTGPAIVFATDSAGPGPGERDYPATMVSRATTLTRAMAQRLRLNEGQYIAVRALHLQMLTDRHETTIRLSGADAAERDTELAALQQRYETSLNDLLRPEQRLAYQNLRSNFTAHRLR